MTRIEASIEIGKAPGEVFAFVAKPSQMAVWMSSVLLTSCTGAKAMGVGSSFHQHCKLLGRVLETTYEVLEYDPE